MDLDLADIDLSLLNKLSTPGIFDDDLISYYLTTVGCKPTNETILRFVSQVAHLGLHKLLVDAKSIATNTKAESADPSGYANVKQEGQGKVSADLEYHNLIDAFQSLDPSFRNFNLFLEPSIWH